MAREVDVQEASPSGAPVTGVFARVRMKKLGGSAGDSRRVMKVPSTGFNQSTKYSKLEPIRAEKPFCFERVQVQSIEEWAIAFWRRADPTEVDPIILPHHNPGPCRQDMVYGISRILILLVFAHIPQQPGGFCRIIGVNDESSSPKAIVVNFGDENQPSRLDPLQVSESLLSLAEFSGCSPDRFEHQAITVRHLGFGITPVEHSAQTSVAGSVGRQP